jgi:hypothetical protein
MSFTGVVKISRDFLRVMAFMGGWEAKYLMGVDGLPVRFEWLQPVIFRCSRPGAVESELWPE